MYVFTHRFLNLPFLKLFNYFRFSFQIFLLMLSSYRNHFYGVFNDLPFRCVKHLSKRVSLIANYLLTITAIIFIFIRITVVYIAYQFHHIRKICLRVSFIINMRINLTLNIWQSLIQKQAKKNKQKKRYIIFFFSFFDNAIIVSFRSN